MRPALLSYQKQTKTLPQKRYYIPMSLMNINAKIFNKILANEILNPTKNYLLQPSRTFPIMQGWVQHWKTNQHINKLKNKNNTTK
jgi:hypothetical protein